MNQLTIDDFLPIQKEVEGTIREQILKLFEQLPAAQQEVLLDELAEIWVAWEEEDDDSIEVEIIEDDEWNKEEELKPLDLK